MQSQDDTHTIRFIDADGIRFQSHGIELVERLQIVWVQPGAAPVEVIRQKIAGAIFE
jgi:hypothetical protein